MSRRLPPPPPVWFVLALLGAWSAVCHVLGVHELENGAPTLAFWPLIIAVAGWIWKGLEVAGQATLATLAWTVRVLWAFGSTVYNAIVDVANVALRGVRRAWRFFRWTYEQVLSPAWRKFWHLVDVVHDTLERVLAPVFSILRRIRDELLHLYEHWVRPVLDTISVARKTLHVLEALHIKWAKKLDDALGRLEEQIDRPFRFLLSKLNEVINLVNRIVTLDGLIQRLALVRSIERDIRYVVNAWHNSQSKPLTAQDRAAAAARDDYKSGEEIERELRAYLETGDGPWRPSIDEWSADLSLRLRA